MQHNGREEMHAAMPSNPDRALCGLPDVPVRLIAVRDAQAECRACLRILAKEAGDD